MRPVLILLAALAALIATPAAAACGNAGGKTYNGNAEWDGGGTYNIELMLKPDCTLTYAIYMGKTAPGVWSQAGAQVTFDLPTLDIHYQGELGGPILEGTMTTPGSRGRFRFVARAETAPAKGPDPLCAPVAGALDPTSRRYEGRALYSGEGQRVMAVTARFNADCSLTFNLDGREDRGARWTQDAGGVRFTQDSEAIWTGIFNTRGVLVGAMTGSFGMEGQFNLRPITEPVATPAPSPCLRNPTVASPAGQTWSGPVTWDKAQYYDMTVVFGADCKASYRYNGETRTGASWSLNGATLSLITVDRFVRYDGQVVGGAVEGRMSNGSGMQGQFRLSPAPGSRRP